ncbi:hypothetical protein BTR23_07605 [Alkalihalophilus pseudofirmus]|nr:hypothetical protein BTR23_07605 [Alkalihalophilus pseudofirmus]
MKKYKKRFLFSIIISGALLLSACGETEAVPEDGELVDQENELVENIEETKEEGANIPEVAVAKEETQEISHIHGLEVNPQSPDSYLIATHHGVVEYAGSEEAYVLGEMRDDFMGFSRVADSTKLMSSGHPGFDSDLPDPLGFMWSEDFGESWEIRSLLEEVDFHGLTASYQDGQHILGFALDYENNFESMLLRSNDQGFNWEKVVTVGLPLDHHGVYNLAFSPESDSIVFAATAKGLLQSEDSGVNWTEITPGNVTGLTVVGNNEVYYYDETNDQLSLWRGDESEVISYPSEQGPINYLVVNDNGQLIVSTVNASLLLREEDSNWKTLIDNGRVK